MTQFALERNPDIHFINTCTFYGPLSVRINEVWLFRLSRFGGGGGGRGLSPQQSCPLTFNFVPMGLRTWYTYVLFRLLFVVVVVFFFLTPWFRYELLKPEPESKLWHTSRFIVPVWSQICFFILNRFIWLSITGTLPDNNTLVHFWVRSLRTRWLKYKLQSTKLGTIQNSTKTYETRVFCPSKMPSANVKRTNDRLNERINNYTTTTPVIWRRHTQNRGLWLVLVLAFCYLTLRVSRDFFFSLYNTSCIGTIMLPPLQPPVFVE